MSAKELLDVIRNKDFHQRSFLEKVIIIAWDEVNGYEVEAMKAAEELAAKDATIRHMEDLLREGHALAQEWIDRDKIKDARIEELEWLLKRTEFAGEGYCPICGSYYGHTADCELAAALNDKAGGVDKTDLQNS